MNSICAATTLALLLQSSVAATLRQAALPIPSARRRLNDDGNLKFNEATFIASHNAHATLAVAEGVLEPLGANQDDTLLDQLTNDGVRGLLLDIMLNEEEREELRLVHASSFVTLDYGGFRSGIGNNLIPFLEEDENAIISLFIEAVGDDGVDAATVRATILGHLQAIFSSMTVNGIALKDMVFKYDHELWKDHEDWPKLDEIRESGQRIFIFTDRSELEDSEYGFMFNRHVMQENHWEGIDECESRYMWGSEKTSLPSNNYWTRLFFMNHFCCGTGPDSKGNTAGSLIGGGNNGWGILYNRVQQCMSNNGGFKPNFIALDWVSQSEEAQKVRDFLNFGGRLGTGQACTDDLHCATSSCNIAMGLCQCQQCLPDSVDVCLGCETGQFCSPVDEEINMCLDKGGTESNSTSINPQPTEPPSNMTEGMSGSPTPNPTENNVANNFYCGEEYFTTVSGCNEAVKCPGGNDDCPDGQTCFAGVDCTLPPTTPSDMPSDSPSSISSVSQSSFSILGDGAAGTPAAANTNFCGTEFFDTLANCQDAQPCPGPNGNDLCTILGVDFTCFSNVACDIEPSTILTSPGNTVPTAPPAEFWLSSLGITKSPTGLETSPPTTTAVPTSSPSSLRPTGAPFAFSNTYYCGANFTDAQDNCYNDNIPCPTQSPSVCGGGTCYGGITCTAPPTALPTSTPTPGPTISHQASPSNPSSNGEPNVQNQVYQTQSPFEMGSYENSSGAVTSVSKVMSGKIVLSIMIAIGFVGQLI